MLNKIMARGRHSSFGGGNGRLFGTAPTIFLV